MFLFFFVGKSVWFFFLFLSWVFLMVWKRFVLLIVLRGLWMLIWLLLGSWLVWGDVIRNSKIFFFGMI